MPMVRRPLNSKSSAAFSLMARNARNVRALGDPQFRIVRDRGMVRAVDVEGIFEGRRDEAVTHGPLHAARRLSEPEFESGAARVADVLEEPDTSLCAAGGLEQDVVVIDDVEGAGMPSNAVCQRATGSDFDAVRDHLDRAADRRGTRSAGYRAHLRWRRQARRGSAHARTARHLRRQWPRDSTARRFPSAGLNRENW